MKKVTRFSPSPTGFLHIGGARTALFNWLYSKHTNGEFLLRIEDTDRNRSTQEATDEIIKGLKWLGLNWDRTESYQSRNISEHIKVAEKLLVTGHAYKCYLEGEELEQFKKQARQNNKPLLSPWRDNPERKAPANIKPVIRLKIPAQNSTTINDIVQGKVTVKNEILDDPIILRADHTPTYILAVVVDDHEAGITTIIRGDDHLNNTFKHVQIYKACNWEIPEYAHIPLIHGEDGAKLSKRHGALAVSEYKEMGILPQAILSYLLRLGWGYKNEDIIEIPNAIKVFELHKVSKAPSRFDMNKMHHFNSYFLKKLSVKELYNLALPFINKELSRNNLSPSRFCEERIIKAKDWLLERTKTLIELAEISLFLTSDDHRTIPQEIYNNIINDNNKKLLQEYIEYIQTINEQNWNNEQLKSYFDIILKRNSLKFAVLGKPLRLLLSFQTSSAGKLFDIMETLGKKESLKRISVIL